MLKQIFPGHIHRPGNICLPQLVEANERVSETSLRPLSVTSAPVRLVTLNLYRMFPVYGWMALRAGFVRRMMGPPAR